MGFPGCAGAVGFRDHRPRPDVALAPLGARRPGPAGTRRSVRRS